MTTLSNGCKGYIGKVEGAGENDAIVIVRANGDKHIFLKGIVCDQMGQSVEEFFKDITTGHEWVMDQFPAQAVTDEEIAKLVAITI